MKTQKEINYDRIAEAIDYIRSRFRSQPGLDEVADIVHVSPAHFQRMFTEWAGTSPKRFLQYISIEHAKLLLRDSPRTNLFDAAIETGLSGTSRLHDLFVTIEGMTPAEYRDGGKGLLINYSFADSPFGKVMVASTAKGICHLAFEEDQSKGFENLARRYPNAGFIQSTDQNQQNALQIFQDDWSQMASVKLHLKATDFQLKVWESLLTIPMGKLTTYGHVADQIGNPNASRAVGTAIGSNPVAYLIPCHRVIRSSGVFGGYMWGPTRKTAMIGWEGARVSEGG